MESLQTQIEDVSGRVTTSLWVRGLVAIGLGITMLVWPGPTLWVLVVVFGLHALIDGVVTLWSAFTPVANGLRMWIAFVGIVGIAAGVVTLAWPDITAVALLYTIGTWAIVVGAIEVGQALFGGAPGGLSLLLVVRGLLRIAFGVIMWTRPGDGAPALITLVAACVIIGGVTLCAMAMDIRRAPEDIRRLV